MNESQMMQRTLKYVCANKLRNCRFVILQKNASEFQTINTAKTWLTLFPHFHSSRTTKLPWTVTSVSLKRNSRALKRALKPIHASMPQLNKMSFCSRPCTPCNTSPTVITQVTIIRKKNERRVTIPTKANIDSTRRPNLLLYCWVV
jgi:hypothetical protein